MHGQVRRVRLLRPLGLAMFCLLACAGCAVDEEPLASADSITMVPVSFSEWEQKLAGYPPDIVVVDLWATWCVSCLERFPHMVELWRRYRDRGVRFVSLNLDDHQDDQALEDARTLLQRFGATFENYHLDENLMQAFERLDLLGIPAVFVYDRTGRLTARLSGDDPNKQFTEADVEAAVLEQLAVDP